ncbi:MAG: hypothetical protein KatS3mg111_1157 [Pirellulaceae bacterium]|nr:MAG: hypothetical protein KatS3mg111_1157 [Pirellulaceae bacterium]
MFGKGTARGRSAPTEFAAGRAPCRSGSEQVALFTAASMIAVHPRRWFSPRHHRVDVMVSQKATHQRGGDGGPQRIAGGKMAPRLLGETECAGRDERGEAARGKPRQRRDGDAPGQPFLGHPTHEQRLDAPPLSHVSQDLPMDTWRRPAIRKKIQTDDGQPRP